MGKAKVSDVIRDATTVVYGDGHKFCNKIIRALLSVVSDDKVLKNKEVEIIGVMCKMCVEGKDYMKASDVVREIDMCGYEPVGEQTLRNYQSALRRKGWLEGRQFNMKLMRAIKDGRFSVMIFNDRGGT